MAETPRALYHPIGPQNKRGYRDEVPDQILATGKRVRNHSRHYPPNGVCRKRIGHMDE
jgi:hypothetical protein